MAIIGHGIGEITLKGRTPCAAQRSAQKSVRLQGQRVLLREGGSQRQARVLFLSMYHLGWKTWTGYIEKYTPACAEIEAVHFHVIQPLWMKIANRPLPKPIGRALVSPAKAWCWHIRAHFRKLLSDREFDAIFTNSQILAPGLIDLCRQSGTKLMVCTDVTGPAYARDLLGQEAAGKRWDEEQAIFNACSLIAPMSAWIADSLANDFNVPRDRMLVVPPVIEVEASCAEASDQGREGLPRILFCGNDWLRKGGPRLVKWHQEHWASVAELHIVSKDADVRPGLKNVVNHGCVPHERLLKEILPSAHIFCLPTLLDMSPFAVSEAQAMGIPTVASRIGGMASLVLDGKTGFLIPPHDDAGFVSATTRLLMDADLRAAMHRAAIEHAMLHLNASVVIPELLERILKSVRSSAV